MINAVGPGECPVPPDSSSSWVTDHQMFAWWSVLVWTQDQAILRWQAQQIWWEKYDGSLRN